MAGALRAALAGLLATLALVASPGPALAQSAPAGPPDSLTIRLLDASRQRQGDPRSRVYVNDHLAPGARITRHVEVTNTTGRPQALSFYAAAASVEDGSFAIGAGRAQNELTSWTTVEPASAVVPDGGSQVLTVRVAVPADAAPGERYAAVLADKPAGTPAPGTVSTATRVGIRMYLSVGAGGEPASDFAIDSLQAARDRDGTPVVQARVTNTGGRALDLAGDLRLSEGPGGLSAGPFPAELGTTLGLRETSLVAIRLDKAITGGPWRAVITLRSGLLERRAEALITFPDEPGDRSPEVVATALSPAEDPSIVVPVAAGLLGLVALLLLLALARRRRDGERTAAG